MRFQTNLRNFRKLLNRALTQIMRWHTKTRPDGRTPAAWLVGLPDAAGLHRQFDFLLLLIHERRITKSEALVQIPGSSSFR